MNNFNNINSKFFQENFLINNKKPHILFTDYQQKKIEEIETHINKIAKSNWIKPIIGKIKSNKLNFEEKINKNYLDWINTIRTDFIKIISNTELYYFLKYEPKTSQFNFMNDYWDISQTDKLFSFSLFISNTENLSYLIGLVYNYAIIRKHFSDYVMRLYIDFHSVFGSPETFNLFNMFIDILDDIDPTFNINIQMIVFFLNPYYQSSDDKINNNSIFDQIVYDIKDVINYYNAILYNYENINFIIKSPLLNIKLENNDTEINSTISDKSIETKDNISINIDNLEINYKNLNKSTQRSTFSMFSTHLAVNLRFLPLNEDCEFHVRDLDSRLCITDINIIKKFSNPKYKYVPFYVFQFYKFYFPYLKWRIDVNPYLAGCFGGSNKKPITISKELEESGNLKILKKEIFFKFILFISFNAANLQIGFLNDEFILANIFEKIKGSYSENILYLNLGSFANKHVNEYYYGMSNSSNYPCILKLGTPIDILRYPLNGKYITIDPITDFKIGNIPFKYHNLIKNLITEQLEIFLGKNIKEKINFANHIRQNYKKRLNEKIDDDLESALFFSMMPKKYNYDLEFEPSNFNNTKLLTSINKTLLDDDKFKVLNIMVAGYLLADVLEDIIFPQNPQFINSNYFLSDDNYDRLFNCMFWDDTNNKFIQKKINKKDISRKYIDQNIISHIPYEFIEFKNKQDVITIINKEFNEYIQTSTYYPSLFWYVERIRLQKFININGKNIKSGMLLFIRNYTKPIYDYNNDTKYSINKNSIKTLKYNLAGKKDSIKGINISRNELKYNIIFVDDEYINQFGYSYIDNKEKINIKLLKTSHIDNLEKITRTNKYNDYILIDNI